MRYASSAAQMRQLDERVIGGLGLPGIALMELAARGAAEIVARDYPAQARKGVLVVCGPGNNGGDGWAMARWLALWGHPVALWSLAEPKPGTDAAIMRAVARQQGLREVAGLPGPEFPVGVIVDAIFGTGMAREVGEPYASALRAMQSAGVPLVAVDVPSGLDADTGRALGTALRADLTVTFGRTKLGFLLGQGPTHTGRVEVVDIGLGAATPEGELAEAELPEWKDLKPLWPVRAAHAHKGDSGHLLVIAGSAAMTGAAILVCRGALAAGVGRLTLLATAPMRARLAALPPEVMLLDGGPGEVLEQLPAPERLAAFDAFATGPGLGAGQPLPARLAQELQQAWTHDAHPWVADADALPCTQPSDKPRVLTPHPGEAARLLGCSTQQVGAERLAAARTLSERGVALLKGRHTVVAAAGALPSLNPTGAPTLATGGSGDVLTGVIGALLARGLSPRDAARLGAFVHGRAGDRLQQQRPEGWTASDIAAEIASAATEPA